MRIAIALALVLAACGDDGPSKQPMPDSGGMPPDAMGDAPPGEMTFTSYVIDLVTNGTSGMAQPRPYSEFAMLPDPDTSNASAYATLF